MSLKTYLKISFGGRLLNLFHLIDFTKLNETVKESVSTYYYHSLFSKRDLYQTISSNSNDIIHCGS